MTIIPITDQTPGCLGVTCDRHGQCNRYHAVEKVGSWNSIGNCFDHGSSYPLFVPVRQEAEAA